MAPELTFSISENPEEDWVSVSPTSDTLEAGESADITIAFDATGLSPGSYFTKFMVNCNDPVHPVDSVQVFLEVMDPQSIGVNGSGLPKIFALIQNYPNPFNPTTTIRYQLPQTVVVRLDIYNSLGQKIRTLLNSRMKAGYHQITWDGCDDIGNPLASGVYLYRIEAAHFNQTRKMLLLK